MHYRLIIKDEAKRKLRLLPKRARQEIGYRLFLMQEDLAGQIKKLKADKNVYRLRVGDYRIIFELERDLFNVYDVGHRKDIYR
jgi:mRNA interferase RelE/StbE